jgi:hypothetical protein
MHWIFYDVGAAIRHPIVSSGGHVTIDHITNNSSVVNTTVATAQTTSFSNPFLFIILGVMVFVIIAIIWEKFY